MEVLEKKCYTFCANVKVARKRNISKLQTD